MTEASGRDIVLRGLVLLGTAVGLITEIFSLFHGLRRVPVLVAWIIVLPAIAFISRGRRPPNGFEVRKHWLEISLAAAIGVIAAIIACTALLSPPNSADAMAYHMPRVLYWAQSGSVAFFPTSYFNQVMLQPLAEYFMLHTYVLSGGDHFVNLVQFLGFMGSVIGVSLVAQALGAGARGQALAALFCATLPNGILQASGAKNDYLLALWLVAMVWFGLSEDAVFFGLSAGLALATKATAYLFTPPLLIALVFLRPRLIRPRTGIALAAGTLLLNGPQYVRNMRLAGSPLGYDSAQGDGFFRWRNEHLGWRPTASNLLRHTADQLGSRSVRWNQGVYDSVLRLHDWLGIDPQDPGTTWRWTRYEPPRNANHEANANNRWHLLLVVVAIGFAVATRRIPWILYAGGLGGGFLAFCFYLKWQPFLARLELPLFVLAAPLGGMLLEQIRWPLVQIAVCLFLLNNARPSLCENWTRRLRGPDNLLATPRDRNYFNDMGQWNNRDSYLKAVDAVAQSGCSEVGVDISQFPLEYPFEALLRERNPRAHFTHVDVQTAPVCAVVCLECAGVDGKIARYRGIGPPAQIGRFLLFLPTGP